MWFALIIFLKYRLIMHTRKVLITSLIIAMAIIFIAYSCIEFRGTFLGPKINLYSPLDGITTSNPIMLTNGISERTKALTINGNQTLIDTDGRFGVNLVLSPGYNIITIVATDSRGKTQILSRNVYYEAPRHIGEEANNESETSTSTTETNSTSTATSSNSN